MAASCNLAESEAIRLAQRGDASAFENLYRLHSRRVYSLCLRMVGGNAAQAEDLTQDAFLQLFKKIRSFRGDSAFSTWLHRITVNIVLMRLRRKSRVVASIEEMNERDDEAGGHQWEPGAPDLQLTGVIDRLSLDRAIAQLPLGYRTMFILHDVQGYEHEEIARIRGCSVGNSKSQLHKARVRLRKLLREAAGDVSHATQHSDDLPVTVEANNSSQAPQPSLSRNKAGKRVHAHSRSARPELRNLLPSRAQ